MRALSSIVLLLAIAGHVRAEGAKEAQALFEAMQAKLAAAKTLQVHFTATKVSAKGNQRPERRGVMRLGATQVLVVAWDPEEAKKGSGFRDWSLMELDAVDYRAAFTRLSISTRREYTFPKEGPKLTSTAFALGPAVEEGDRKLQVVEFTTPTSMGDVRIKLWIDTATKLPVRRELKDQDGNAHTEAYSSIELDPDLGPDAFAEDALKEPPWSRDE